MVCSCAIHHPGPTDGHALALRCPRAAPLPLDAINTGTLRLSEAQKRSSPWLRALNAAHFGRGAESRAEDTRHPA